MSTHLAKAAEAGLAAEGVQDAALASNTLTTTSSRTNVDHEHELASTKSGDATNHGLGRSASNAEKGEHTTEDPDALPTGADESGLLTGFRLYGVFGSLMLGVFLFALDQSIVATAIPVIVSEFNAFTEVGWLITAYFLTQTGLILLVGQALTVFRAKYVLLLSFFFFELGSLICAVSKQMDVLIFGRAIQGIGTSGMFSSMMLIITVITRVEQRPAFLASFGFVFVISSVVGPLLGGVFTDHVSWRWCFWINLPIGGLAAAAVVFLLPVRDPVPTERTRGKTTWQNLRQLDFVGAIMVFGIIVCLLLALADGGNKYAWGNWRIILEFVLAGVLIVAFALWELRLDEAALIPKSVLKNRTEVSASIAIFMTMCVMLGGTYQLPLFYQVVKNHSPTKSGIDIIPFMLACCIGIFISGGGTQKTGRYWPWLLIGPPFAAAGFGALYTIDVGTSNAKLIGFQILAGIGIGFSFQNILLSVQAEFHERPALLPIAIGVSNFFQLAGAAIGIGIVNLVQSVYLNSELRKKAPNVPFELVRQSVTAVYTLSEEERAPVIEAYVAAITSSMLPIFIAVAIAFVASVFVRNHDLKKLGGAAGLAV